MECLYSVETKITFNEYRRYVFSLNKRKIIIDSIISLFILTLGIILQLLTDIPFYRNLVILFPLIYYILIVINYCFGVRKKYNSNKLIQNANIKFDFYKDFFEVTDNHGASKLKYCELYKIIETKTNFYLMVQNGWGYLILKENMPDGLELFIKNLKIVS